MPRTATRTSPRKPPPKRVERTPQLPKANVNGKGNKEKKVRATTAVKDKVAPKHVKTPEVAPPQAAENGGQPNVRDVDVGVDNTVAQKKARRTGGGKGKAPPESSEEPVKTTEVVAPSQGE